LSKWLILAIDDDECLATLVMLTMIDTVIDYAMLILDMNTGYIRLCYMGYEQTIPAML